MEKQNTPLCENENCKKPAKLECPTCIKLGCSPSYFCSQTCFKQMWLSHKVLHKPGIFLAFEFDSWTFRLSRFQVHCKIYGFSKCNRDHLDLGEQLDPKQFLKISQFLIMQRMEFLYLKITTRNSRRRFT